MRKYIFLKVISLGFFIALFSGANLIWAQAYKAIFATSKPGASLLIDFQNDWESWLQSNTPSINSSWLEGTSFYSPDNQPINWTGNTSPPVRNPFYTASFYNSNVMPGFPDLSRIQYNASLGTFYAPGLMHWDAAPKNFPHGATFWSTNDRTGESYELHFFREGPVIYTNGTLITEDGASQIKTITIEDDGKTVSFSPGEMFRIVLPMYDEISMNDFPRIAGWEDEDREQWFAGATTFFGFEPETMGLEENESGDLIQVNTYRALHESGNEKTLVFNYHKNGQQKDTFEVTIQIRGAGMYAPRF
ncbi:MAG: hypothetical protein ACMUIP_05785 [bacterium]